jgi:hypothetical protein
VSDLQLTLATDQRGVDVHILGRGDLRRQAGLNRALEDVAKPLFAPAPADARQNDAAGSHAGHNQ